jgi:hypothetical protein
MVKRGEQVVGEQNPNDLDACVAPSRPTCQSQGNQREAAYTTNLNAATRYTHT